jgi:holin-like protein
MIETLTALLLFQLVGEAIAFWSRWPVPGPVLGMALMLAFCLWKPALASTWKPVAATLLQHLALLFIPAGVGIMLHFHRLQGEGLAIAVALILSTVLGMAVTALMLGLLLRRQGGGEHD